MARYLEHIHLINELLKMVTGRVLPLTDTTCSETTRLSAAIVAILRQKNFFMYVTRDDTFSSPGPLGCSEKAGSGLRGADNLRSGRILASLSYSLT